MKETEDRKVHPVYHKVGIDPCGRLILRHDGVTEWADCSVCGAHLDGMSLLAPEDWDGSCWVCGAGRALVGLRAPDVERGGLR